MNDPTIEAWKGYAVATLILFTTIGSSLLMQHAQFISARVSVRVRSALVNLVYRKCLRMANTRTNSTTTTSKENYNKSDRRAAAGDFENFVASDMQRLQVSSALSYSKLFIIYWLLKLNSIYLITRSCGSAERHRNHLHIMVCASQCDFRMHLPLVYDRGLTSGGSSYMRNNIHSLYCIQPSCLHLWGVVTD